MGFFYFILRVILHQGLRRCIKKISDNFHNPINISSIVIILNNKENHFKICNLLNTAIPIYLLGCSANGTPKKTLARSVVNPLTIPALVLLMGPDQLQPHPTTLSTNSTTETHTWCMMQLREEMPRLIGKQFTFKFASSVYDNLSKLSRFSLKSILMKQLSINTLQFHCDIF